MFYSIWNEWYFALNIIDQVSPFFHEEPQPRMRFFFLCEFRFDAIIYHWWDETLISSDYMDQFTQSGRVWAFFRFTLIVTIWLMYAFHSRPPHCVHVVACCERVNHLRISCAWHSSSHERSTWRAAQHIHWAVNAPTCSLETSTSRVVLSWCSGLSWACECRLNLWPSWFSIHLCTFRTVQGNIGMQWAHNLRHRQHLRP